MLDIVGKRYWCFLISALVLIPGVVFLALFGLPLSIDFTSGAILEIAFEEGNRPQPGEVKELLGDYGLDEATVQTSSDPATGSEFLVIRTVPIDTQKKNEIKAAIEERFAPITDELRFESIGARVSTETTRRALYAVGLASLAILLYICWAFRHVPNPVRFGTCATIATIHDVFVVVGVVAILGRVRGWEVDALFLTALLTVIGFSVHDTIVVFDRIRENMKRRAGEPIESIVNHSIIQTIDRSLNTELGVLFTLTALLLFGGGTIRVFAFTLLIGIVSATYCSIFDASPLLVEWERRPERLLYALSFVLPPLGGVMGGYLLLQGDRRIKGWARGCLMGAGAGALFITLLLALKLTQI